MDEIKPDAPVLGVNQDGVLHCGRCGSADHIRYEESVIEWRDVASNQDGEINVTYDGSNTSDGDGVPGLICSTSEGGCGHPIELPDGFELTYD